MLLHHTVTICLFAGSYLYNCLECAAVLAFLHDIADVAICLSKIFMETNMKCLKGSIFVLNMTVWFYTRCFLYPYFLYQMSSFVPDMGQGIVTPIFFYLLICLFILHWYWFYVFVVIFLKFFIESKIAKMKKSIRDVSNYMKSNRRTRHRSRGES